MTTSARLFVVVAALLSASCINLGLGDGTHPAMHRHSVDGAAGVTARPGKLPGVAVRPFGARARYDIRVLRRDGPDEMTYLEFDRWAEPPADATTDAVREGFAASRAFESVSSATDALAVDLFVDGYVLAFDLEKTASGPWKARFAARLSLSTRAGESLGSAVYETSRDLPGPSAAGVGPAMAAAIGEAVNRALADWTSVAAPR